MVTTLFKRFGNSITTLYDEFVRIHAVMIVNCFYGGFWSLRDLCRKHKKKRHKKLYFWYLEHFGSWIGLGATFDSPPVFPHGFQGIFISNSAVIGNNVVIFHQVTIGSNMTYGSKNNGAPKIGNNVYIGCGAKIIGKIQVGDNSRIGANTIVVKDVPPNSVTITRGTESLIKAVLMNNEWVKNNYQ